VPEVTSASSAQALVGAVLNRRWRLVRLLGEGGMGAVYEAEGTSGEGKRAIKILHQEYVGEQQILNRFFTEAQAVRSIQHPNVAQIMETGTAENGTPYLVMELLSGIPVSTYVDQGQVLPPAQAVHIVHGILSALSATHQRNIIHRDIKPDNLFLVRDANGSFNVKVLDFGIAKVMDAAGGMGQKTRTGVLLGTPGYMSPEQIKNSKGVDGRSDLWSVGIIFYELLTGTSPFPADNEFARLTSVLTEEVKPIDRIAPHLAAWTPFFQRALAKEPAQRFQTADEMAAAMLAAARGNSMRPPPTLQGQAPPPAQGVPSHSGLMTAPMAAVNVEFSSSVGPPPPPASAAYAAVQQQSGLIQAPPPSILASQQAAAGTTVMPVSMASPQSMAGPTSVSGPFSMGPQAAPNPAPPSAAHPRSVAAVSQGSIPPPTPSSQPAYQTIASAPNNALPAQVPPSNVANIGPTHVSAQRPPGTPPVQSHVPSIDIIEAPKRVSAGAPWWVVGVIAFVAFGLGIALGALISG
jgi:serine/threonine-protein kinase